MRNEFKVIIGSSAYVESQLNKLNETHLVYIQGVAAANNQTTVVVEIQEII